MSDQSLMQRVAENSATTIDGHVVWIEEAPLHPKYGYPVLVNLDGSLVNVRAHMNAREDKIEGYLTSYRVSCRFATCLLPEHRVPTWRVKDGFVAA